MLNCKIRFTKSWISMGVRPGDTAMFIEGALHYPNGYVGHPDYRTISNFQELNPSAEFEVIEWEGKPVKIEDHPAFKNDAQKLPRICYILGGEKTPLKIGEEFLIDGISSPCKIKDDGHIYVNTIEDDMANQQLLEDIINGTRQIIRRPQFSDDEKALMRLNIGIGLKWYARDQDNEIVAYPRQPHRGDEAFEPEGNDEYLIIPSKFFAQITWENSPFDAAAYLESEANHD